MNGRVVLAVNVSGLTIIKITFVLGIMLHVAVCSCMESLVVENPVSLSPAAVIQAKANLHLGRMLLRGEGCERNYEKARQHFEKALEQNDDLMFQAEAYFHLGKIYYFGRAVEKDE